MTQTPHDALFKAVFSRPERAAEELRHALGPELARAIDFTTLQLVPGSVVDETLHERHTDLLFSVRCGRRRSACSCCSSTRAASTRGCRCGCSGTCCGSGRRS